MTETIQGLLAWYLVFLFSTTFHEFAHAYLAFRGGDMTAYETGHVTLSPAPHIRRSPVGMIVLPILSYLQLGWMMGFASVPFNADWGKQNPRRQALMSLAGPGANLVLALTALGLMRGLLAAHVFQYAESGGSGHYVEAVSGARSPLGALALVLGVTLKLNVVLFLFNLIPVPPLDGASVLAGFFPGQIGVLYQRMRQLPAFELLGLLLAWRLFPYLASPAFALISTLVYR